MLKKGKEPMQELKIYTDEHDVETRLFQLGINVRDLEEAAKANFLAQASCNQNDARIAAGISGWIASVRALREALTLRGWIREDLQNSPRVICPNNNFSVMFATGG